MTYWGLRDYQVEGQLGLEPTPEAYVAAMVGVFREVRRVLRADGTLWLNMGDGYTSGDFTRQGNPRNVPQLPNDWEGTELGGRRRADHVRAVKRDLGDLKPKDLVGMPWRLAFALQADGWYLRADIIWAKPNPMPESVTDRPTKAHEYVFLLSKKASYFYDADAVREPSVDPEAHRGYQRSIATDAIEQSGDGGYDGHRTRVGIKNLKTSGHAYPQRNLRSVWTLATEPTPEAHFATFPTALASRCIQAGSSERGCCAACGAPWARQVERTPATVLSSRSEYGYGAGRHDGGRSMLVGASTQTTGWAPACACDAPTQPCTVLDPFAGTGTVGAVAEQLGRHSVLIELSPAYVRLADRRTAQLGLFTQGATA